jgi:hypothetical protein
MSLNPGDLVSVDFPGATGMKRRPAVVHFHQYCAYWSIVGARLERHSSLRQNGFHRVG